MQKLFILCHEPLWLTLVCKVNFPLLEFILIVFAGTTDSSCNFRLTGTIFLLDELSGTRFDGLELVNAVGVFFALTSTFEPFVSSLCNFSKKSFITATNGVTILSAKVLLDFCVFSVEYFSCLGDFIYFASLERDNSTLPVPLCLNFSDVVCVLFAS